MEQLRKLYIGNLRYDMTGEDLTRIVQSHGFAVDQALVVCDPVTGRSRGFGFVYLADARQATAAVSALAYKELGGRRLTVNVARNQERSRS